MMTPEPHPQHIILRQQHQQQLRKKTKQYPPSIPAATFWATADYSPLAKRRMPVAPLIRLSAIDRLPQQHQLYPERRPQTPPPAYTGTLPPRYEDISQYSDDDEPLAQIQQRRKNLGRGITDVDSRGVQKRILHDNNNKNNSNSDESSDEHETLDKVQQRLKSAYNLTK